MIPAIFVALLLVVALSDSVNADLIHVPGDYPTIQQAVDNSSPGDEIVIDAGTYAENVVAYGLSNLRLRSSSGAASTIVDGGFSNAVFRLTNCQDITLEALTIRHGDTGVLVHDSVVRVQGNIIEDNRSTGDGGGLWVVGSNVVIEDNQIVNNSANVNATLDGGGIYCYVASGVISRNRIEGNRAHEGGGIIINANTNPSLLVSGNVFAENDASYYGGGIYVNQGTDPEISQNTVVGNSAGVSGGGIWYTQESAPVITRNIIAGDSALHGGGVHAFLPGATPTFACNDAWENPGGNYAGDVADPTGSDGNISADPLFCNVGLGDYRLNENSPCAPAHSPSGCGLIGALDVGCGPTAVEPSTWGRVKSLYSAAKRSTGQ